MDTALLNLASADMMKMYDGLMRGVVIRWTMAVTLKYFKTGVSEAERLTRLDSAQPNNRHFSVIFTHKHTRNTARSLAVTVPCRSRARVWMKIGEIWLVTSSTWTRYAHVDFEAKLQQGKPLL